MRKVNDIVEARRKGFEVTAREHYFLHELDHSWSEREQEYHDSDMQVAWEVYNSALDSAYVELPVLSCAMFETSRDCAAAREGMDIARLAIERAGLKVKP